MAFVFPGQGGQWAGMGAGLAAAYPGFARRLGQCAAVLDPLTGWPLLGVLNGEPGAPRLERVEVVQPALWAVMVALAGLWEDFGVAPSAVAGHSQGEVAAAVTAGVLSLADGARVVAARSRVLAALAGTGAMASLPVPAAEAAELAAGCGGRVSIAAVNGPRSVVVSGDRGEVRDLAARVAGARLVEVDYASHSPAVERVEQELLAALDGIEPGAGRVPFYSAVTGQVMDGRDCGPAYWYANLRQPVMFEQVTRALLTTGHGLFIEASPHPVLTYPLEDTIATFAGTAGPGTGGAAGAAAATGAASGDGAGAGGGATALAGDAAAAAVVTGTLRRGDGGPARMLTALATAWACGAPVDWAPAFPGARTTTLPTYPFQHQRYWLMPGPAQRAGGHPLVPQAARLAEGQGAVLHRAVVGWGPAVAG